MTDSGDSDEIANIKARLAALEARSPTPSTPIRHVSVPLFIGILIMPYVFVWFLLRRGYSPLARLLAFRGLALVTSYALTQYRSGPYCPPPDPQQHNKDIAAAVAKLEVIKSMHALPLAQFGPVWGMDHDIACGYVTGEDAAGAQLNAHRFIFADGKATFDDGSIPFKQRWTMACIDRPFSPTRGATASR